MTSTAVGALILTGLLAAQHVEPAYARLQRFYAEHAGRLAVHPQMRPLLADCRAAGVRCGLFTGRGSDSTRMIPRFRNSLRLSGSL